MGFLKRLYEREINICIGESIVARQLFDAFSKNKNRFNANVAYGQNDAENAVAEMLDHAKELVMGIHLSANELIEPSFEAADVCIQALANVRDNAISRNENRAGASIIIGVLSIIYGLASLMVGLTTIQTIVAGYYLQIMLLASAALLLIPFVLISRKSMNCILNPCNEMMSWFYLLKMNMRVHAVDRSTVVQIRSKIDESELCEWGLLKDNDRLEITYDGETRIAVVHYMDGKLSYSDEAHPSLSSETLNSLYRQMFPLAPQRNVMEGFRKGNQTINELKMDLAIKRGILNVEYVDLG